MTANDATHDGSEETGNDRPTVTQQYSFSVGEDGQTDGEIEPAEESVETSLEAFGADVDHREQDTRIDQPEATTFGVDDRPEVTSTDGGEQGALFADTEDDQQTLTGERAASQCLFETDSESDTDAEDHDVEPAPSTTASNQDQRALADGGRVEDDDETTDSDDSSDEKDETFDADAETVTEAWEGAYISASWGYNQTNVELAQIVDVSDTGKSVLARFVEAERVGHGRTSEQLRPTAERYGDEFRLQVREIRGGPRFRGSHPLSNNGDMDGETRRGTFRPWSNDADSTIRQTATNYGH